MVEVDSRCRFCVMIVGASSVFTSMPGIDAAGLLGAARSGLGEYLQDIGTGISTR